MAKKLAGIGAGMIGNLSSSSPEIAEDHHVSEGSKDTTQYGVNLNFRVPAEFRRRFRGYAASHDLKLNEVLLKAFDALVHATP